MVSTLRTINNQIIENLVSWEKGRKQKHNNRMIQEQEMETILKRLRLLNWTRQLQVLAYMVTKLNLGFFALM